MKRKYIILLLAFMFLISPYKVKAASATLSLSCSDVVVNETTKCVLSMTSSGMVAGFNAKYSTTGGIEIESFTLGSGWSGEGSGSVIDLYTDSNKSGTFTIGTFIVKGKSIGTAGISITDASSCDPTNDFLSTSVPGIARTFKVVAGTTATVATTTTTTTKPITTTKAPTTTTTTKKITTAVTTTTRKANDRVETTTTNAVSEHALRLTSLSVDDFKVTLNNGVYYATVNYDTESVMITATAAAGITIYGTGVRGLAVGENSVELTLTDGTNQTTVPLLITRPSDGNVHDTRLKKLKVVGYNIEFQSDTLEYNVSIPYNTSEVYIIAEPLIEDAIVSGAGLITINKGKNVVYINVSYKDLSTTTYTIHLNKNYLQLVIFIGMGIVGGGFIGGMIYLQMNKKKAVKNVVNEKNKIIAEGRRGIIDTGFELNGEKAFGIGRNSVNPTPVSTPSFFEATPQRPIETNRIVTSRPVNEENVETIQSAPATQVKVVRKVVTPNNVNGLNVSNPFAINTQEEQVNDNN